MTSGELGLFYIRTSANGRRRVVDHRDRALASLTEDQVVLSGETLERPGRGRGAGQGRAQELPSPAAAAAAQARQLAEPAEPGEQQPPAADADMLLAELEAFGQAYLRAQRAAVSHNDLDGVIQTNGSRLPPGQSAHEVEVTP